MEKMVVLELTEQELNILSATIKNLVVKEWLNKRSNGSRLYNETLEGLHEKIIKEKINICIDNSTK